MVFMYMQTEDIFEGIKKEIYFHVLTLILILFSVFWFLAEKQFQAFLTA